MSYVVAPARPPRCHDEPVPTDLRTATDPTSRRREAGTASARSLLLTVLGEFVHPRHTTVWTATLIEALGALGVEEKSARQSLTRTAREGHLTSTRHGRRVLWELTRTARDCSRAAPAASTASWGSGTRGTGAGWC